MYILLICILFIEQWTCLCLERTSKHEGGTCSYHYLPLSHHQLSNMIHITSSYIDLLSMMITMMMMMILIMVIMIMMIVGEREREKEVRLIVLIDVWRRVDVVVTSTCNLRALFLLFLLLLCLYLHYVLSIDQYTTSGWWAVSSWPSWSSSSSWPSWSSHVLQPTNQVLIASGHVFDHLNQYIGWLLIHNDTIDNS